ncbi:uncharacterized protein [Littorina saxatilis]|uniref:uncharacterized protein n=1 Tax=Littorina saxatilis TaxID=31220 RepID=UPI0038B4C585
MWEKKMDATLLCLEVLLLCGMLTSVARGLHFENVALNKPCTMSSRLSWGGEQHLPDVAVNGDTNGTFIDTGNCIHTKNSDTTPWWEVDLGRSYPVYSVVVWARNGYESRMKGCIITVDGQECYRFDNTPASRDTSVTCTSGVLNGSVVRVSKDSTELSGTINMCEFEVISKFTLVFLP